MTAPAIDFSELDPQPVPLGVPDHTRSSGERGERPETTRTTMGGKPRRPGILGARTARTEKPTVTKVTVPKLGVGAKKQIEKFYILAGGFLAPMNEVLGEQIIEAAPKCAEALYDFAQTNDKFRAILIGSISAGAGMALVLAHLPIILAVIASYSRNDKVKMTAAGTLVALKFADEGDMAKSFKLQTEDDESVAP